MPLIYHYTNSEGLLGIIGTQSIWATDINFLNDFEEFSIGKKVIRKSIDYHRDELIKKNPGKLTNSLMYLFYNSLASLTEKNANSREYYITSFTKKRDYIRQWMSYGNKNSSYSIAFDKSEFLQEISINNEIRKNKLQYTVNDVSYSHREILEELNFNHLFALIKEEGGEQKIIDLIDKIDSKICSIKHENFSDEDEVRAIAKTIESNSICANKKFRTQSGVITPYTEIPFPKNLIKEIIIGPNNNKECAELGVRKLLKLHGIECKITHTRCTLRQF